MAYGAQVRTNKGLVSLDQVFGLQLLDTRRIQLTSTDNQGNFQVHLQGLTYFNSVDYQIFCIAGKDSGGDNRRTSSLTTYVDKPATIYANNSCTVYYRGGISDWYTFQTWIAEV